MISLLFWAPGALYKENNDNIGRQYDLKTFFPCLECIDWTSEPSLLDMDLILSLSPKLFCKCNFVWRTGKQKKEQRAEKYLFVIYLLFTSGRYKMTLFLTNAWGIFISEETKELLLSYKESSRAKTIQSYYQAMHLLIEKSVSCYRRSVWLTLNLQIIVWTKYKLRLCLQRAPWAFSVSLDMPFDGTHVWQRVSLCVGFSQILSKIISDDCF